MSKLLFFVLLLLCLSMETEAAHFQTIFNNIEQGPGGVSNPSIVVNGQKAEKTVNEENPHKLIPIIDGTSTGESVASVEEPKNFQRFRLMALGNYTSIAGAQDSSWSTAKNDAKQLNWSSSKQATPSIAGSFFLDPDLAITGFWAHNRTQSHPDTFGLELDFTPIRVAVLGKTDFIEIAALFGASNLGRYELDTAGTLHVGARGNVNFHRRLGITTAVRTNASSRSQYRYTMAEAGLTYRF